MKRFAFALLLSIITLPSLAKLHCPSVTQVKTTQITNIQSACFADMSCNSYGAYGLIEHDGEVWAVGTGVFSRNVALSEGQSLLKKAESPSISSRNGTEFCLYYVSYWYNQYVGALPYKDMPQSFSFVELFKAD